MIPRLRPPFDLMDIFLSARVGDGMDIQRFEQDFADIFDFPYGLFFPYGRSAMHALIKAGGFEGKEILMPAYTCAVIPHAIRIAGGKIRFLDSALDHFNVPAANLRDALSPNTAMMISTPIFGYPVDKSGYRAAFASAESDCFELYDLAHGFVPEDIKGPQSRDAPAALFGLGISKTATSIYGGMLLLRDLSLYSEVKAWRDANYTTPSVGASLSRFIYAATIWAAFRNPLVYLCDFLERQTKLLDPLTEYYYSKDGPRLPEDNFVHPTQFQARVGRRQLGKLRMLAARRWSISETYEIRLKKEGFVPFESKGTPAFSHFPLSVARREEVVTAMRCHGIQLGNLIDYSCPDLPGYEDCEGAFPNARRFGRSMINLPNWPGMQISDIQRVVEALAKVRNAAPQLFERD